MRCEKYIACGLRPPSGQLVKSCVQGGGYVPRLRQMQISLNLVIIFIT